MSLKIRRPYTSLCIFTEEHFSPYNTDPMMNLGKKTQWALMVLLKRKLNRTGYTFAGLTTMYFKLITICGVGAAMELCLA